MDREFKLNCAFGFILAICWIPGWTGGVVPAGWVVLSATLPFLVTPTIVGVAEGLGLAALAYAALTLFWSADAFSGIGQLWQWGILAFAFWWGKGQRSLEPLLVGIAFGLIASYPIVLTQAISWPTVSYIGAPAGLFFNPSVFASLIALTIVGLVIYDHYILVLSVAPLLLSASSRSAVIAIAVVFASMLMRQRQARLAIWLLLVAAAVALAFGKPFQPRLDIWLETLMRLTPFGNGLGSFHFITPEGILDNAHNEALNLMFLLGIGGALPLLFFVQALESPASERELLLTAVTLSLFTCPLSTPIVAFLTLATTGYLCGNGARCVYRRPAFLAWLEPWRPGTSRDLGTPIPIRLDTPHLTPSLHRNKEQT